MTCFASFERFGFDQPQMLSDEALHIPSDRASVVEGAQSLYRLLIEIVSSDYGILFRLVGFKSGLQLCRKMGEIVRIG